MACCSSDRTEGMLDWFQVELEGSFGCLKPMQTGRPGASDKKWLLQVEPYMRAVPLHTYHWQVDSEVHCCHSRVYCGILQSQVEHAHGTLINAITFCLPLQRKLDDPACGSGKRGSHASIEIIRK